MLLNHPLRSCLLLGTIFPYLGSTKPEPASADGLVEASIGALKGKLDTHKEFDYIVVGGGTGGNAVGTRLAEAGFKVAIVEAGAFYEIAKPVLGTTPAGDIIGIGWNMLDAVPTVDWTFQTEPQAGANNRKFHYAQGKCVGGSSALNFMIYHRGTTGTYDQWADAVGDDSYRYVTVWQRRRGHTFTPPDLQKRKSNASTPYDASDYLPAGQGGPVQVGYSNWVSSWSTWLEQGLKAVGMQRTTDFNKGKLLGYHYTQTTIRNSDATRSSSAQYIYKAMADKVGSLKVFTLTQATKILFDSEKKATGVEVSSLGIKYTLKASKEVIVSGGAFKSPQLLMVSGVGPKDTLDKFKIPVVAALPGVGQNMWDHIFFGPSYAVKFPTIDDILLNPLSLAKALAQYVFSHDGVLSSNIIEFVGWEKLPDKYRNTFSAETKQALAGFSDDWPEVEYLGANGFLGTFEWPLMKQPLTGKQYATILGALVAPLSRGNVTLKSASGLDDPAINPNWLTDKADQEVAVASFKRMREVWNTPQLKSIVIGNEYWPGQDKDSDAEILEMVRNSLMTVWHPSCTCKMGKKEDKMAVVDSAARVFGVQGVRVVDASAFPILPPGHPQSSIYALAEKIADHIIQGQN
ncbi:hypothetical protein DCS_05820 [Drechmeria coniospora]|uniref:Glucose-methanol-choline oxidoreductase N-terminal domain-containing protein n=1 Tax=Drechmeria coniospora TaxID=98403 RepID=A0A151GP77_DRECN|nr:hypothetical protein DCS_05820 [Drechmeria coniospora]KYK58802.1 hypothetical protein DCS_05820 [Drechmeria coniospora]